MLHNISRTFPSVQSSSKSLQVSLYSLIFHLVGGGQYVKPISEHQHITLHLKSLFSHILTKMLAAVSSDQTNKIRCDKWCVILLIPKNKTHASDSV